jgi:hypothetical protein
LHRDTAHRLDRVCGKTDDLDTISAVATYFGDRMGWFPVGESWYDEQIDRLAGQEEISGSDDSALQLQGLGRDDAVRIRS